MFLLRKIPVTPANKINAAKIMQLLVRHYELLPKPPSAESNILVDFWCTSEQVAKDSSAFFHQLRKNVLPEKWKRCAPLPCPLFTFTLLLHRLHVYYDAMPRNLNSAISVLNFSRHQARQTSKCPGRKSTFNPDILGFLWHWIILLQPLYFSGIFVSHLILIR